MVDNRSIASKASSIVLGVDDSGQRWWKGSAVKGSFSPYFNPAFNPEYRPPLTSIANLNVRDAGKANHYSKLPEGIICGKKVVHRRKNQDNPDASEFPRVNENLQDQLLQSVHPRTVKFSSGNQGQAPRPPSPTILRGSRENYSENWTNFCRF